MAVDVVVAVTVAAAGTVAVAMSFTVAWAVGYIGFVATIGTRREIWWSPIYVSEYLLLRRSSDC